MKVVHVLKRIEAIDEDIKDLKKLEKSISREKSFSTPIYMSIEQQINILLGERVKLFELPIENPPEGLVESIEGADEEEEFKPLLAKAVAKKSTKKEVKKTQASTPKGKKEKSDDDDDDLPLGMLTQDQIDSKISNLKKSSDDTVVKAEKKVEENSDIEDEASHSLDGVDTNDESVKLLDIVLDKGDSQNKTAVKEKRRVRFFKDNFPGGEY